MNAQALAILEAQWRIYRNHFRKMPAGTVATILFALIWYGLWAAMSTGASTAFAELGPANLAKYLPLALLGIFLYWQVFPILLMSSGVSLDLRKLQPYPIPLEQIFWLEVMLRVTAGLEMLLLLAGVSIGLARNIRVPIWGPFWLLPFVFINLFFSTGLRDLLVRVFARKRYREFVSLLVLVLIALPQVVFGVTARSGHWPRWANFSAGAWWPWSAEAMLARGTVTPRGMGISLLWLAGAYGFARWQFRRTYVYDADVTGMRKSTPRRIGWADAVFSLPSRLLHDPLGAIVEKELRFLSRAPRFRVLFMMGFSFGLLIFLPSFLRSREQGGFFANNFLTMIGGYALLLLGEVLFWNNLGFDRSAVQAYFITPVRFRTVLMGKNLAAVCFALLEIGILAILCAVFRLAVSPGKILEAVCVVLVLTLFLTAVGNLSSVRNARPVNPTQAMRGQGAGRAQMMLFLLYPLALLPVGLAFAARFAFESQAAFYGVLLLDAVIGVVVYHIALDSAEAAALRRQEELVADLSKGPGLVSA